jgi:hypothetical protein
MVGDEMQRYRMCGRKKVVANNNCPQVSHQCAHGGLFIGVVIHCHYNVCNAPVYLP